MLGKRGPIRTKSSRYLRQEAPNWLQEAPNWLQEALVWLTPLTLSAVIGTVRPFCS
jgi:hypothetical protein